MAGAGHWALPPWLLRAVVLPDLLPWCHGNQAAREPRWRQSPDADALSQEGMVRSYGSRRTEERVGRGGTGR